MKKYNFNNLHSKIESVKNKFNEHDKNISVKKFISRLLVEENELIEIINLIKKIGFFVIDTETDSIKPTNANLIGISLSWRKQALHVIYPCYILKIFLQAIY